MKKHVTQNLSTDSGDKQYSASETAMSEPAEKFVRVSANQRKWLTRRFNSRIVELGKKGVPERVARREFWEFVGITTLSDRKKYSVILRGGATDTRRCHKEVLEKCLQWIKASWNVFLAADRLMPDGAVSSQVAGGDDFFLLAEKSLSDAISKDDQERIDDIMHLIDAVIFTQRDFTANQLKSLLFSIVEFIHMGRDRAIPLVSDSQEGYAYGWFRLWLWMKHIVSVLRQPEFKQKRDAGTGTRLWLFVPWCEITCVKMLRHKLFMKNAQQAPAFLLGEIRTTIRHSFLQSLCDGAKYYLTISEHDKPKDMEELEAILHSIPELDESECRKKALRVAGMLQHPLELDTFDEIKNCENRQEASDILQARIVLAQIMENWGRYLCSSTDEGDMELLEALAARAEEAVWVKEIASMCSKDGHVELSKEKEEVLKITEAKIETLLKDIPIERDFLISLFSLAADIYFLKARQIGACKTGDKRLEIRMNLQGAGAIAGILKGIIMKETGKNERMNLVGEKAEWDLARKLQSYARYCIDCCLDDDDKLHFEEGPRISRLAQHYGLDEPESDSFAWWEVEGEDGAIEKMRNLYKALHLNLPWEPDARSRRGEILDKLYWDFEMALWLEYDLRLSIFECQEQDRHAKTWRKTGEERERRDADYTKIFPDGKRKNPYEAFAKIVLLYSEMTWGGYPSTEHSVRAMARCRKWAFDKLRLPYHEPRKTKMNPAELLKLAVGTFLTCRNNPKCGTEGYVYQKRARETSFIAWATAVLGEQASRERWDDAEAVEALRTFLEIVWADFRYLCQYVQENVPWPHLDKESYYLKATLRRKGEVPYPWTLKEEISLCADKLEGVISWPTRDVPKSSGRVAAPEEKRIDTTECISSVGYKKLRKWIQDWRSDLAQNKKMAPTLGVSEATLSNLCNERVKTVSLPKRKRIIERAADILGVEYSEVVEEISGGGGRGKSTMFDRFDLDTDGVDKKLERFVRVLRNISGGEKSKWGFDGNKEIYEKGLARYFANLELGEDSGHKTRMLFREWEKARHASKELWDEIRGMMERGGVFYGMPDVYRWFMHTKFSGTGDAVNVLKLGFACLELAANSSKYKIDPAVVRTVGIWCGNQLAEAKPDWDGTKVLNAQITELWSPTKASASVPNFPR